MDLNRFIKLWRPQLSIDKRVDNWQVDVDEFETRQLGHQRFVVILLVLVVLKILDKVDSQLFECKVNDAHGRIQKETLENIVLNLPFEEDVEEYRSRKQN